MAGRRRLDSYCAYFIGATDLNRFVVGLVGVLLLTSCSRLVKVRLEGDGTGLISAAGSSCRTACELEPPFLAVADEHSRFDGWSDGCSGVGECRPTGGSVTGTFTAVDFPLRLSQAGEGALSVAVQATSPGTIWVPRDTTVLLAAAPAAGWLFARWEVPCQSRPTPESCEILVDKAVEAKAVFEKALEVTVVVEGGGEVAAVLPIGRCSNRCSGLMRSGSKLAMTATSATGFTFAEWVNGCAEQADCDLTITQDVTVTARFQPNIELTASGDGAGTITGLTGCAVAPCSLAWGRGRRYQFQAVAAENSRFVGFVGCPDARGAQCIVSQYSPSIQLVFEKVTLDPILGDGPVARGGLLVSTASAEFAWLKASGQLTLGGVAESQSVLPGRERWVLFQTRPGPTRELLPLGSDAEALAAEPQLDGGMVFVARALTAMSVGGQQLAPFEDVIASMTPAGGFEWTNLNSGPSSDILALKTDRITGQSYVVGGLRPLGTAVTYGATTITPPMAGSRLYLGSLDRHGRREWAAPRFDSSGAPESWPLFSLTTGPAIFDTAADSTAGAACLPSWTPSPTSLKATSWSLFSSQGACSRSGLTSQNSTAGSTPNIDLSVVVDGPGPGLSMIGSATGPSMWSLTPVPAGLFYAWQQGADEPIIDTFSTCTNSSFQFAAPVGPTTIVLAGSGPCIPDIETTARAPGALVVLYDRQTGRVTRGWHQPGTMLHSMVKLNDREVRILLTFNAPARIGGVDYPQDRNHAGRFLLLTLRP